MKTVSVKREGLADKLQKARIFRYFTIEAIDELLDNSDFVRYEEHERLIEEGEVDDHLFVIIEKSVSVMVHEKEQSKEVYICTLGAGDVVGEASIFADFKRTASVVANDTLTMVRIRRPDFINALRKNPQSGLKILFMMIHSLLTKLREVNLELAFERRDNASQESVDDMIDQLLADTS